MIRNYKKKSFKKNHPANLPWNRLVRGVCVRQIPLLAYSAALGYMSTSLHLVAAASFFFLIWVLGIQTQFLMLAQQEFYRLYHILRPESHFCT